MILRKILKFIKKNLWFGKKRRRGSAKRNTRRSGKIVDRRKRAPGAVRRKRSARAPVVKKKRIRSKSGAATKGKTKKPEERLLGEITHYFPKVRAGILRLKRRVQIGMPIHIKGSKTDFRQTIGSMQINRTPVASASSGDEIGLEVLREVSPGDRVYLST